MLEDDIKESSNKSADVNKLFEFNNVIVTFEEMLEECTRCHISFWNELL